MKEKIKLDFIKIKDLCSVKGTVNSENTRRKSLQNTYLIKDLYPKYAKNS